MIQKETSRAKTEECLNYFTKLVVVFNSNFDQRTRAGLPSCWDFQGNLVP